MKLQTCIYKKEQDGPEFLGVAKVLAYDMPVVLWIINMNGKRVKFADVRFPEKPFGNKLDTGA